MKRSACLSTLFFAFLLSAMQLEDALAETVKLRMANFLPPAHHMGTTLRAWADELETASNGELELEIMTSALAKANGQYDLAKNDIVDIVYSVAAFQPKRFWKLKAVEIPFSAATAEIAGVAAWRWYEKNGFIEEDTSDTKLLTLFAHAPHLYHSTKPLTSLAEFKDLKIRAAGHGVKIAEALDAIPVSLPPTQTYEAMLKGTIDASQFPWETVKPFKLDEVSTHHLVVPGGMYAGIFVLTMSLKTWEKLSDSQKMAVTKVSGEWGARFLSQRWDSAEQVGRDAAAAAGNVITTLSDAEVVELKELVMPITEDWLEQAREAGLDGEALLKDYTNIVTGIE